MRFNSMSNVSSNFTSGALYMKNINNEKRIEALREAVVEAHRILLHELDNGRVPTMLKAEHGGKGLGYFEDLIK